MPATKFTITGAGAQAAGSSQVITITADDVGYVGDHSITFSGAADPPFVGITGHPTTANKVATPIDFGSPCVLTFVLGVATSSTVLLKAETIDIACTDGSIVAAGADRLHVVVTAAAAFYFDWSASGAAQVAGVGFTFPVINAVDPWGNIDLTYNFPAGKAITFSAIGNAPIGTVPTVTDDTGAAVNFGTPTTIDFNNGVAVTGANQLKVKYYLAGLAQVAALTDGSVVSVSNETAGFLTPKTVNVVAAALDNFAVVLATGQRSTVAFTGVNTITARDVYQNAKLTFDASLDNVTITTNAAGAYVAGVITGLSGVNKLSGAGDFVNGVASLSASLIYTGVGGNAAANNNFIATSAGGKTGNSNTFGITSKFTITGGAAQVAGAVNTITITADSTSYTGDHDLTFSGAAVAPFGTGPTTKDKNAVGRAFGTSCTLTFVAGVVTSDMVLTKVEVATVATTDGVIVAAGADRLSVTVTAGVATFFDYNTDNGPTVVAGVQFQILTINAEDGLGNIDLTYNFPGGKNITFQSIGNSPSGAIPTVTDRLAAVVNFGTATSLVFNNGVAVADGIQLKVKFYLAALAQRLTFSDGLISSALNESPPFLNPKLVDVLAAALDHFVFVLGVSQEYTVPFIGTNTLTALDVYQNVKLTFNAAADNVTIAPQAPLVGAVTGLSGVNKLTAAGDFVLGVCTNLTGTMIYTGTGDGTFLATSVSAKTGLSNAVGFNLSSQGNPILIDSAMALSYQNGGSAPNHFQIYPRVIKWNNPGAAGHKVIITDINGKVLFTHTAQAQYKGCYVVLNRNSGGGGSGVRWKDFIVTQIDSGELFIWYTT